MQPVDVTMDDSPLYNTNDGTKVGRPAFVFKAKGWLKAVRERVGTAAKRAGEKQRKLLIKPILTDKDEEPQE